MALERAAALASIRGAIEELNQQWEEDRRLGLEEDTPLFGAATRLDSLDLVNLIVAIEDQIATETGHEVVLASEAAMSRKRSPYQSIATLADYAVEVSTSQG